MRQFLTVVTCHSSAPGAFTQSRGLSLERGCFIHCPIETYPSRMHRYLVTMVTFSPQKNVKSRSSNMIIIIT